MNNFRVIPVLLFDGDGFVKTINFGKKLYLGDPINIIKIFNEKEVDELIVLDITASLNNSGPNFDIVNLLADECFMPLAYGGGISNVDHARQLFASGVEKVIINSHLLENSQLAADIAEKFGSQAVVAAVDVKINHRSEYCIFDHRNGNIVNKNLYSYISELVLAGSGELFINSVDRDGMRNGFDINLIKSISSKINIPLIACGGANSSEDLIAAVAEGGASAAAGGSIFTIYGEHHAVLISYPKLNFSEL